MIIPDNDFLKTIGLSTELYELLLEKLNNSVDQLQDILDTRNRLIIYNKGLPETTKDQYISQFLKASNYNFVIRNKIAEVRLYRGLLTAVSYCEDTYERGRDE